MFFIPGFVISFLTFPGIVIHEIAHRLFADLAHVRVYEIKYFIPSFSGRAGYVIHGPAKNVKQALMISTGPLIVNTFLCSIFTFVSFPMIWLNRNLTLGFILFWIGLSMGVHAFPSHQDMKALAQEVEHLNSNKILIIVAKIFSWIFMLINALKFFWIDFIYAFAVALVLPTLFAIMIGAI